MGPPSPAWLALLTPMVLAWFCSVGKKRKHDSPPLRSETLFTECLEHLTALLLLLQTPGEEGPQGLKLLQELRGLLPDVLRAIEESLANPDAGCSVGSDALFLGEGAGCALSRTLLSSDTAPVSNVSAVEAKPMCLTHSINPEGLPQEDGAQEQDWRGEEWSCADAAEERMLGASSSAASPLRRLPRASAAGLPPPRVPPSTLREGTEGLEDGGDMQERAFQVSELRRLVRLLSDPAGRTLLAAPDASLEQSAWALASSSSRSCGCVTTGGGTLREILQACSSQHIELAGADFLVHQARDRQEAFEQSMASIDRGVELWLQTNAEAHHRQVAGALPGGEGDAVATAGELAIDPADEDTVTGHRGPEAGAAPLGQAEDEDVECERYMSTQLPDGRVIWMPSVGVPTAALTPWVRARTVGLSSSLNLRSP